MIRRLLVVALWLAGGGATAGALYWCFLATPESRIGTLALSALLVVLIVVVTAAVINVALLLAAGERWRVGVTRGLRGVHYVLIAAVPALLLGWAVVRGDRWLAAHSGEVSAWFIATFGWADVTWLFRAEAVLSLWLRWVAIPSAALASVAAMLSSGVRALGSRRWMLAAGHWRTLAVASAAFVLLVVLPWRAAHWQPPGLPPTWVEPALAAARLLLVGGAIAVGAAIVLVTISAAIARRA